MEGITCESSDRVSIITAFPGTILERVGFRNCDFRGIANEDLLKSAAVPGYQDVSIKRGGK